MEEILTGMIRWRVIWVLWPLTRLNSILKFFECDVFADIKMHHFKPDNGGNCQYMWTYLRFFLSDRNLHRSNPKICVSLTLGFLRYALSTICSICTRQQNKTSFDWIKLILFQNLTNHKASKKLRAEKNKRREMEKIMHWVGFVQSHFIFSLGCRQNFKKLGYLRQRVLYRQNKKFRAEMEQK